MVTNIAVLCESLTHSGTGKKSCFPIALKFSVVGLSNVA